MIFFLSIDSPNITKKAGSLMEILCACLMGSESCMTMCDLSWKITCSVALVVTAVLRSSSDPTLPLSHPRLLQLTALSRNWSWQERETKMKETKGCCCWILKQVIAYRVWNFSLKFLHVKNINTTSRCVNHVYTLPPKLSSIIKKFGSGLIFCVFASVASILIRKNDEYGKKKKMYTKISDSVCNHH